MNLDPLLNASPQIQIHAYTAITALVLGIVQLVAPKGTLPHKQLGVVWLGLMIVTTISAYFIQHPVGPGDPFWARFSWIHLFIILNTWGISSGVALLLFGGPERLKYHAKPFIGMFFGGLVVAGVLSFIPGRIMHAVVFGGQTTIEKMQSE